ncbi:MULTISPECIES: Lsr2 family protein [Pseudarthrobacter]|uniref:histone-like nucleoid-structuring protein Lsr2 n=1 Tax=Pseudarthrobacter TaxID=1742993 RepID=UPI00204140BD|nr:Lsr2 family protein [Pseudarthrobacter sp. NCCP-2145]GKV72967.1 Lsr2 family protein [Pseudarthrobacter sp. NCCP-2145]
MATRTVIVLIDDLDGSEATETVRFGLDGADYEIDLTEQNADELRGILGRCVDAGRRTGGSRATAPAAARSTTAAGVDTNAIRRWAEENGVPVNSRGRIKDDVVQRYLATLS